MAKYITIPVLPVKFIHENGQLSWDETKACFDLIEIKEEDKSTPLLFELRNEAGLKSIECKAGDYIMRVKKAHNWSDSLKVQIKETKVETAVIQPVMEKAVIKRSPAKRKK